MTGKHEALYTYLNVWWTSQKKNIFHLNFQTITDLKLGAIKAKS